MVSTWLAWSAKHKWVSRANAGDEWIARTSDDQIVFERDGVQTGAHHAGA